MQEQKEAVNSSMILEWNKLKNANGKGYWNSSYLWCVENLESFE